MFEFERATGIIGLQTALPHFRRFCQIHRAASRAFGEDQLEAAIPHAGAKAKKGGDDR